MGVFRIATGQAIREIIEEHGSLGRFGLILTPENIDSIADRIVDLFEMTIELRTKTQEMFMNAAQAAPQEMSSADQALSGGWARRKKPVVRDEGPFLVTKNAQEMNYYETPRSKGDEGLYAEKAPYMAQLPRRRV